MAIPYTGLFIAASCNSRSSTVKYTRYDGNSYSVRLLGQNCRDQLYKVRDYVF